MMCDNTILSISLSLILSQSSIWKEWGLPLSLSLPSSICCTLTHCSYNTFLYGRERPLYQQRISSCCCCCCLLITLWWRAVCLCVHSPQSWPTLRFTWLRGRGRMYCLELHLPEDDEVGVAVGLPEGEARGINVGSTTARLKSTGRGPFSAPSASSIEGFPLLLQR